MACAHKQEAVKEIQDVKPSGKGCVECLKTGGWWVHLRMCLILRACGLL